MTDFQWNIICRFMWVVLQLLLRRNYPNAELSVALVDALEDDIYAESKISARNAR